MELRGLNFKRILVQRCDRLGDVIFTLPVLDWLRAHYPDAEIHYLASKLPGEFLESQSVVDRVHVVPSNMSLSQLFSTARLMRHLKFDLYISIWNEPQLAWLGKLAQIPVRIGDSTNRSIGWLYTHTVRQTWENMAIHQVVFNMQLLRPLGWRDESGWKWRIDVNPDALSGVQDIQESWEPDRPVVTFFCGTGGSNLPISDAVVLDAMAQLGKRFSVVLVGQVPPDSKLLNACPEYGINVLNNTSVVSLVAWISVSDVVIGADTGPIHIAAALDCSVVFCPIRKSNLPARFGPWTSDLEILRQEYLCTTTPPHMCGDSDCLALPDSTSIVGAVDRLVDRPVRRSRSEVELLFLRESFRILVVVESPVQGFAMERLAGRWRQDGMILIPLVRPKPSVSELVALVLRHNALVVMCAHLPFWKAVCVRLVVGIRYQYLRPIIARRLLKVSEPLSGFLNHLGTWILSGRGVVS